MSETSRSATPLQALGDAGLSVPLPPQIEYRARVTLMREIDRANRDSGKLRSARRHLTWLLSVPGALAVTAAVAAAATSVIVGINFSEVARHNAHDSPLTLFERNPGALGGTPAKRWHETVIPSTVHELGAFTLPGIGSVAYWTAQTRQRGICGALRLPNGTWAGIQISTRNGGGSFPGCRPTRRQVGDNALIIDGFDYIDDGVIGRHGQRWDLVYGKVTDGQTPARIIDTHSGRTASIIRNNYFVIAVHPVGNDWDDLLHLKAFSAHGKVIATQGTPLPGTPPQMKCVGPHTVVRRHIPGTHRTIKMINGCSKFAPVPEPK